MSDNDKNTGIHIGAYKITERLGSGGMGSVFRAEDEEGKPVALKVLDPDLAEDQEFVNRFLREIATLSELNHPNIVHYYKAGYDGEKFFYAMEFVDGQCLSDLCGEGQLFPESEALEIGIQLASVLDYAAKMKLVHRDIKPDNIIIEAESGQAKLLDLGLARDTNTSLKKLTRGLRAIGTVGYMSPEQAQGREDMDIRCDIYGLGATLYQLLNGTPPFHGDNDVDTMRRIIAEEAPPLRDSNPAVSRELNYIISKMLRNKRERRYQNPGDVLRDLTLHRDRQFILPEMGPAARRSGRGRAHRQNRLIRWLIIWGILAIIILGLLFLLGVL